MSVEAVLMHSSVNTLMKNVLYDPRVQFKLFDTTWKFIFNRRLVKYEMVSLVCMAKRLNSINFIIG
ncbi:uncharacterized protein MELLADRAFT_73578 [Melampsora larici-populina 98AG31]|uniref:Uncharacterized protein n=1 Tax=Melampsora larici-populina (strain 98AG31 / pathotype 3-4-7) TaxID=747676 RepID=F4S9T7_MELLP|nr:uncharacterized protein MELLADRAFT_73578 [Melampsora larici-populina 98AG31]EGF98602.1 hypothetical protein MELLADRAFT_73578 [Melampsora larici-populina 98AG31]